MEELRVTAKVENLDLVLDFLNTHLESMDCPMKAQMQLDIAVEELFVNIATYSYAPGTGDAVIRVEKDPSGGMVKITLIDKGVPYDPLAKEDPDVTLSAEERQIGGLGIFMVKKSVDDMYYEYKDGENRLTLCKRI